MGDTKDKKSLPAGAAEFSELMGDAQPLNSRQRHQKKAPHKRRPGSSQIQGYRRAQEPEPDVDVDTSLDNTSALVFFRPQVTRNTQRQLRRGKIAVQDDIDLHGMTIAQAEPELSNFIQESLHYGLHCVRVVHGKGLSSAGGEPVIKPNVNRWLRQWSDILGFCPALQQDGGSGAVYVLLKPPRD
jgi:DNA-nicking Smr family endonuclease